MGIRTILEYTIPKQISDSCQVHKSFDISLHHPIADALSGVASFVPLFSRAVAARTVTWEQAAISP